MTQVMQGIRVLEVAQYTFVPAAGAVLAEWGADVIKIEPPGRGDTQRGFLRVGAIPVNPLRNTVMEHPNRGKRSVGVDLTKPEGQELIYDIARTADVFLTNYLPAQRAKLRIDPGESTHNLIERPSDVRNTPVNGLPGFAPDRGIGECVTCPVSRLKATAAHS